MKRNATSRQAVRILRWTLPVLVAVSAFASTPEQEAAESVPTESSVRTELEAVYERWARARVEYDRAAMESILAPEARVILDDEVLSRDQFLQEASTRNPGARITRFDADILTVRQAEEGWQVVISEKLEYETTGADGEKRTGYSFWITRDGCRLQDGKWLLTYSEAIGYEYWRTGKRPPFGDW